MELKELSEKICDIFKCEMSELGSALMCCLMSEDAEKMDLFCELVEDLNIDWLQKVFQYYYADRKEKMQDFTPPTIAYLMGKLVGDADIMIDMCAGTGALTIQKWTQNKEQKFNLYELDTRAIPFLLFNIAVRNIDATIYRADVLKDEIYEKYIVRKGERYGRVEIDDVG